MTKADINEKIDTLNTSVQNCNEAIKALQDNKFDENLKNNFDSWYFILESELKTSGSEAGKAELHDNFLSLVRAIEQTNINISSLNEISKVPYI